MIARGTRSCPKLRAHPAPLRLALGLLCWLGLATGLPAQSPSEDAANISLSPYETALLNYKNGHFDAALGAIEAAEKMKSGDPATEILKARILTELLKFDEATKVLNDLTGNAQMTPALNTAQALAFGDLCLRKRSFNEATKFYESLLSAKPNDPDLTLKLIYARIGAADLTAAAKYASLLKPFDSAIDPLDPKRPGKPCYYFAKAALGQATGDASSAEEDIETSRTVYGNTVTEHYLKTYLELFAPVNQSATPSTAPVPATNAAPAKP